MTILSWEDLQTSLQIRAWNAVFLRKVNKYCIIILINTVIPLESGT